MSLSPVMTQQCHQVDLLTEPKRPKVKGVDMFLLLLSSNEEFQ